MNAYFSKLLEHLYLRQIKDKEKLFFNERLEVNCITDNIAFKNKRMAIIFLHY